MSCNTEFNVRPQLPDKLLSQKRLLVGKVNCNYGNCDNSRGAEERRRVRG